MGTGDDVDLSVVVHGVGAYTVLALGGMHRRSRLQEQAEVSKGAAHTITHAYSIVRRQTVPPSSLSPPSSELTWYSAFWCTHTPLGSWKKEWEKPSEAILSLSLPHTSK